MGECQLGLGAVAHCNDHRNPLDRGRDDGLCWVQNQVAAGDLRSWHVIPIVVGIVGALGLLLAALHGIEAAIWAAAYLWLGALDSPQDAILYSVDSMSTRGARSGVILEHGWRIMGALEAAGGMLLFGISTAFIFTVMQLHWPTLSKPLMTRRHPR
jgi:hypothetical protein